MTLNGHQDCSAPAAAVNVRSLRETSEAEAGIKCGQILGTAQRPHVGEIGDTRNRIDLVQAPDRLAYLVVAPYHGCAHRGHDDRRDIIRILS